MAWSSRPSRGPNVAMSASPMMRSISPSWRRTIGGIATRKYAFSIAETSSGPRRSANAVKPFRSANRTVISWTPAAVPSR